MAESRRDSAGFADEVTISSSRIAVLAAKISELTAVLDRHHTTQQIPHPSFAESYWQETTYPKDIEQVRTGLADACRELDELVTGPRMMIQNKAYVSAE